MRLWGTLRICFAWLAAVVLLPVAGGFFVEYARQKGLYDDPEGTMNSILSLIVGLSQNWWYQWLAWALVWLCAGIWLDYLLRRVGSRADEKMRRLAINLKEFAERVYESPLHERDIFFLLSIAEPLERELETFGIDLNAKREGDSDQTFMSRVGAAYFRIAPYLREGDVRGARRLVEELNAILAEAPLPLPHQSTQS